MRRIKPSTNGHRPTVLRPSVDDIDAIKAQDEAVVKMKVAVANKLMELRQVELALVQVHEQYIRLVMEAAKSLGIDTDDDSQTWNFDADTMTFTRTK